MNGRLWWSECLRKLDKVVPEHKSRSTFMQENETFAAESIENEMFSEYEAGMDDDGDGQFVYMEVDDQDQVFDEDEVYRLHWPRTRRFEKRSVHIRKVGTPTRARARAICGAQATVPMTSSAARRRSESKSSNCALGADVVA